VPRRWLATELFIYGLILGLAGLFKAARLKKLHYLVGMPLALVVMHFAWGGGFLWSMISIFPREKKRNG
ncbi:MAG: glycosyltransferase family 2 protein, partial [Chloroflexota bacterium]